MSLWDWGQTLLALLFPERCPFCDAISVGGGPCESCTSPDHGESCARDLPEPGNVPCFSPFRYEGEIREAILRFKFRGRRDYASWFGGEIAKELLRRDVSRGAVLTPVPISAGRMRERGYNQSLLLARAAARVLEIPCVELLEKVSENQTQHLLSLEERRKNVRHVYRVKNGKAMQKEIILLDDIVTTGYTLAECAATLREAGLHVRCCAALASAADRDGQAGQEDEKRGKL